MSLTVKSNAVVMLVSFRCRAACHDPPLNETSDGREKSLLQCREQMAALKDHLQVTLILQPDVQPDQRAPGGQFVRDFARS